MPVYWFALSQLAIIDIGQAALIFFILHMLVYPASNGYNSYMDRDEGSIGGLKKPMQPTRQLFFVTVGIDLVATGLSLLISVPFTIGIVAYILVSRAYSYRGIRLKRYPLLGYFAVVIFQGAVTFWIVYHGASIDKNLQVPLIPMLVASLLIGGFYPLTQIYQFEADRKDGVTTLSYMLGYRATFIFCGVLYVIAFVLLAYYYFYHLQATSFYVLSGIMLPVLLYFFYWAAKVWKDTSAANFYYTMRMNTIAASFTSLAFIIILFMKQL